ncbi:MAG: hypothetical protein SOV62_08270 [Alloprevotella sp.]|nr:hypothetical protein [Alloprevotella sp.]
MKKTYQQPASASVQFHAEHDLLISTSAVIGTNDSADYVDGSEALTNRNDAQWADSPWNE